MAWWGWILLGWVAVAFLIGAAWARIGYVLNKGR